MNTTTEFLLAATERVWELHGKLAVRREVRGGPWGLYLNERGIGPYPWWSPEEGGELLSVHASYEEAEKARIFLMLQFAADLRDAEGAAAPRLGEPLRFSDLARWQQGRADAAFALAGEERSGPGAVPGHWRRSPHWFCAAGHVSTSFVEREGGTWLKTGCPRCGGPALLGPALTEAQFAAEANACRGPAVQQPIEA
jgi:hypothetical protein